MTYPPKIAMCLKEDTFSKPSFLDIFGIYVKFSGVYMFGVYQCHLFQRKIKQISYQALFQLAQRNDTILVLHHIL